MIYSDKQLKITKEQLQKLKDILNGFGDMEVEEMDWAKKAQYDSLFCQYEDLAEEAALYEKLKAGKVSSFSCNTLSDLPAALIHARIASGLSQSDLAQKLGMKAQQIQRYEATEYASANLSKLTEISNLLEVKVIESWQSSINRKINNLSLLNPYEIDWNLFPLKEMRKRGWFNENITQNPAEAARHFFEKTVGEEFIGAMHRKRFRGENEPDEYFLLAWQAYVIGEAHKIIEIAEIPEFRHDDTWIDELARLSIFEDGPLRAQSLLAEHGIVLIIERHFDNTYLDGAAMLANTGHPVIGMTLRYDRLDNFWFVLFHELGHVFLHLQDQDHFDFFDDNETSSDKSELETQADEFALEKLIPAKKWKTCLSRFKRKAEIVIKDSKRLGISPSIIAGRIRKDANDYTILNELIGQSKVRKLWGMEK
ncbi:ImmA/IrrE family metallo-endopeptidase [Terasakiella sp.]|uniref:ImmA/IrrE family metallo-endopeptidase n=1 Tax=Terasakiella sp. TaxID=2034861 RepID=UPI003AA85497